jgi:hypothetical protein
VCGQAGDNITVVDQLTGGLNGCYFSTLPFEQLLVNPGDSTQCSGPLFTDPCGSFAGNIDIVYFPASSPATPSTRDFLDTLGLGGINSIGGNFRVFVTDVQNLGTIAPEVFAGLVTVGGSFSVVDLSVPPAITSIGGLTSLVQVSLFSLSDIDEDFQHLSVSVNLPNLVLSELFLPSVVQNVRVGGLHGLGWESLHFVCEVLVIWKFLHFRTVEFHPKHHSSSEHVPSLSCFLVMPGKAPVGWMATGELPVNRLGIQCTRHGTIPFAPSGP